MNIIYVCGYVHTYILHVNCSSVQQSGSARGRGERRPMLEVTPITAGYYECNFGHIVLGHSGKKARSESDRRQEMPVCGLISGYLGLQLFPRKRDLQHQQAALDAEGFPGDS